PREGAGQREAARRFSSGGHRSGNMVVPDQCGLDYRLCGPVRVLHLRGQYSNPAANPCCVRPGRSLGLSHSWPLWTGGDAGLGTMVRRDSSMNLVVSRLFAIVLLICIGSSLSGCGYNTIPTKEEEAKARWSDVQNQYQRRADLIPNLVATVQG